MKFSSGAYEKLIGFVGEESAFYDASLPDYKDHTLKRNIWKIIAKEMNMKNLNPLTIGACLENYWLSIYGEYYDWGGVRMEPLYGAFSELYWFFGL